MIRYNYRQSFAERVVPGLPALDRLRVPLAVAGAALLALPCMWSLEAHRLAGLDEALAAVQARQAASAGDRIRAQRLLDRIARMRKLHGDVAAARRDGIAATNAIARIGNALPSQTWLTALGATPSGTWTIAGRSTRVNEIGMLLRRVQTIDATATARLVSVAATGRSGRVLDFVIGWDRHP